MTTEAQLVAAPLDFTANGKTYVLGPLVDSDFGRLLIFVQEKITDLAKRMAQGLNQEAANDLMRHAFDKAMKVQLTGPDATEWLASLEGGIMIAWLSLQKHQPTITREEVVEIMSDPNVAPALMAKIEALRELHQVSHPFQGRKPTKAELKRARKKPRPLRRGCI